VLVLVAGGLTAGDRDLPGARARAADAVAALVNQEIWDADPADVAERTAKSFEAHVGPWLLPR
jgi:hypothetical protein